MLERVGQLAIGGDDRGCSSIFVFCSNGFSLCCNVLIVHDGFIDNDNRAEWGSVHYKTNFVILL